MSLGVVSIGRYSDCQKFVPFADHMGRYRSIVVQMSCIQKSDNRYNTMFLKYR